MALEQELAAFERELPTLLRSARGEYVLIHGNRTEGTYPTENQAYEAGCARFGLEPFLVMRVTEHEEPLVVMQDIQPHAGYRRST